MKLQAARSELIEVATGIRPADFYIKGGTIINVYSGEFLKQNIAIFKDSIAYVGESELPIGKDTEIINAEGMYVSPGFIESHTHPWVIYNPLSFAGKVLTLGTTTIVCDNLFFYLHMGAKGLKEMIKELTKLPSTLLWLIRLISQADYPGERDWFNHTDIRSLLDLDEVVGTAELTRWPLLYNTDPFLLDTVEYVHKLKKVVDGHAAGCSYDKLNALAAAGLNSCHEAITAKEALDRLRLGLWTLLRNSSLRPDLPDVIKLITDGNVATNRVLMTNDGPHPTFIEEEGFTGGLIRTAVALGVPVMQAVQMVTINAATFLHLDDYIGGIAPGRQADILLLPDLVNFRPEKVMAKGQVVAVNGKLTVKLAEINWDKYLLKKSFAIDRSVLEDPDFYRYPHPTDSESVPVIYSRSTVITKRMDVALPSANGFADLTDHEDLIFGVLINRDGQWVSRGILSNFASRVDGLATTFNTTTELLVMGRNPQSMALAASRVHELNGGIVLLDGDKIILEIPLPLIGMMTMSPSFELAVEYQNQFLPAMFERGYPFHDVLYSLLFITCDFLPGLRLTPRGLYDVQTHTILNPAVTLTP